jgi:hypothetical protein
MKDSKKPAAVLVVPNKETGHLVTEYDDQDPENGPVYGYIHIEASTRSTGDGWLRKKRRATLIKGVIEELEEFIDDDGFRKGGKTYLPGKIFIHELQLDEDNRLPAAYEKRLKHREYSREYVLMQYLKRAGKEGPVLYHDGKPIFKFANYLAEPRPSDYDVFIEHDNYEEVELYRYQKDNDMEITVDNTPDESDLEIIYPDEEAPVDEEDEAPVEDTQATE